MQATGGGTPGLILAQLAKLEVGKVTPLVVPPRPTPLTPPSVSVTHLQPFFRILCQAPREVVSADRRQVSGHGHSQSHRRGCGASRCQRALRVPARRAGVHRGSNTRPPTAEAGFPRAGLRLIGPPSKTPVEIHRGSVPGSVSATVLGGSGEVDVSVPDSAPAGAHLLPALSNGDKGELMRSQRSPSNWQRPVARDTGTMRSTP